MILNSSPTELTTGATDALLAIECAVIVVWLSCTVTADRWRCRFWCWVFGLLGISSFLGGLAHGLQMPGIIRAGLWKPLFLSLGVVVVLFLVGAISDWRGEAPAKRLVSYGIGAGAVFFALTELMTDPLIVFVVCGAGVLTAALAVYTVLAATRRLKGAAVVSLGVFISLAAGAIQVSHVYFHLLFHFDHNGVFHLVQMVGIAFLAIGLGLGMAPGERDKEVPTQPI